MPPLERGGLADLGAIRHQIQRELSRVFRLFNPVAGGATPKTNEESSMQPAGCLLRREPRSRKPGTILRAITDLRRRFLYTYKTPFISSLIWLIWGGANRVAAASSRICSGRRAPTSALVTPGWDIAQPTDN